MFLQLNINFNHITWQSGVYLFVCIFLLVLAKTVYQVLNRDINVDDELVEKDNFAFSLSHVGYYVAILVTMGGIMVGEGHNDFGYDVALTLVYGVAAIGLLNLSAYINDQFILRKFDVKKEIIKDRNAGTGVIEAGNYIAVGFIIYGALMVQADEPWIALVYYWIGQVLLLAAMSVYSIITPYDVHDEIEKDNVAAGVGYAGALIALGNLVAFGIATTHQSWAEGLIYMSIDVIAGLILIPVLRIVTDKLLLPKRRLTDEIVNQEKPNVGAALVEAFAYIAGSVLFTWCW